MGQCLAANAPKAIATIHLTGRRTAKGPSVTLSFRVTRSVILLSSLSMHPSPRCSMVCFLWRALTPGYTSDLRAGFCRRFVSISPIKSC